MFAILLKLLAFYLLYRLIKFILKAYFLYGEIKKQVNNGQGDIFNQGQPQGSSSGPYTQSRPNASDDTIDVEYRVVSENES